MDGKVKQPHGMDQREFYQLLTYKDNVLPYLASQWARCILIFFQWQYCHPLHLGIIGKGLYPTEMGQVKTVEHFRIRQRTNRSMQCGAVLNDCVIRLRLSIIVGKATSVHCDLLPLP